MCQQCEINPVYEFTNKRKLCKTCFVRYFQKKVLYTIRKFELISKGEIIGYENKGDLFGVVLEDVLKMFSLKAPVELVKLPSKKKISKKAVSLCLDVEASQIINALFNKSLSKLKVGPIEGKIICPLYLFLEEEIELYAKLRSLKYKKIKIKSTQLEDFVNSLEEKHPEIKRAIVNSYLELFE